MSTTSVLDSLCYRTVSVRLRNLLPGMLTVSGRSPSFETNLSPSRRRHHCQRLAIHTNPRTLILDFFNSSHHTHPLMSPLSPLGTRAPIHALAPTLTSRCRIFCLGPQHFYLALGLPPLPPIACPPAFHPDPRAPVSSQATPLSLPMTMTSPRRPRSRKRIC